MKAGEKGFWNGLYVVVLSLGGEQAHIRVIGRKGQGNEYDVPFREIKPQTAQAAPAPGPKGFLDCPACGLNYPNYRSGVECPACFHGESASALKTFGEWVRRRLLRSQEA